MKKNTGIPRAAVAGLALCAVLLTGCTNEPQRHGNDAHRFQLHVPE